MQPSDELAFMDALAQAELVRKKEIRPIELVDAAIARIEKLNPAINAVVTPMFEQARKKAHGEELQGPFAGVPFLLKDVLAACKGIRMTLGSALLKSFVPDHDSELVRRFKRTGLIILGKTNTPEFGILPTTEPRLFGPCRNPWDLSKTAGGSSGGSAAAVAVGMAAMAHGNDGGGSIRIPASCCGLFGLKPTRGRNPLGPDFGDLMSGLICEHAITRSVRDSAALLDAVSGPDAGDPYWAPPPARPFSREVGEDPGRLRIAFTTRAVTGVPVHADCVAAVQDAAALCTGLGHEVSEVSPELDGRLLAESFTTVWSAGCAQTLKMLKPAPDQVEPLSFAMYEMGLRISAPDYLLAVQRIQRASRVVAGFFSDFHILLTPTLAEPPVPLGTFDSPPENPLHGFHRSGRFAPFTALANMTGQPAMSLPLFWNEEGLPVGSHFIGRFGDEATLFRLAGQLEAARPWAERRPPAAIAPPLMM